MSNNLIAEHQKKHTNSSNEIIQIIENFNQLDLKDENSISEIVKELYNRYNEESFKSTDLKSIINSLDQILMKKKQNPDNIINWCLDNQNNPMAQIVLARCYRFGKWIEKNEHKAFIHYQKFAEGIYSIGVCYDIGINVKQDENKAFIYYQKAANMGHVCGIFNVGCSYEEGIGVEKNNH
ncbi:calmodulin-dependent protein kinase [Gigaspora margarita]|uniref:Calmodulin-dependent protein kinase n=1 Tax=Gigaspora margarita TaxID=4874 RepID=A0A8H4AFX6_GIGMA|nr:calmodulin-dependent protein kinase [Gigaspora margarita]